MADQTDSATAPETHSPKSFMDLEGPICDANYMAGILCDMIDGLMRPAHEIPKMSQYLYCPEDECEKLEFAAYHLKRMLFRIKDSYYAAHTVAEFEGEDQTPVASSMAALSRQWKISRAERDLEFAKDQSPELIGIAKAQEKHDNTAKAIFAAIEGADDFEMGVGDARAVVDLALSLIKDEDEEYLDDALPLLTKARHILGALESKTPTKLPVPAA